MTARKQHAQAEAVRDIAAAAAGHHVQQRSLRMAQRLTQKRLAQIYHYLAGAPQQLCT